jgi:hypothetical protein
VIKILIYIFSSKLPSLFSANTEIRSLLNNREIDTQNDSDIDGFCSKKYRKEHLQEMEIKINSNKKDRIEFTDNLKKSVFAFEIRFGLITKRDLESHYWILK